MNLPNTLTIARLFLTAVLVASLSIDWPYRATAALGLFAIASITDWADGAIARAYGLITNLGKLLDPLADKVLVCGTLICLLNFQGAPVMPAWMIVLILTREFLVTGLRVLAAAQDTVLPADWAGKYKTISQIVAVGAALVFLSLQEFGVRAEWLAPLLPLLYWLATALTMYSGWLYCWNNRELFKHHE